LLPRAADINTGIADASGQTTVRTLPIAGAPRLATGSWQPVKEREQERAPVHRGDNRFQGTVNLACRLAVESHNWPTASLRHGLHALGQLLNLGQI